MSGLCFVEGDAVLVPEYPKFDLYFPKSFFCRRQSFSYLTVLVQNPYRYSSYPLSSTHYPCCYLRIFRPFLYSYRRTADAWYPDRSLDNKHVTSPTKCLVRAMEAAYSRITLQPSMQSMQSRLSCCSCIPPAEPEESEVDNKVPLTHGFVASFWTGNRWQVKGIFWIKRQLSNFVSAFGLQLQVHWHWHGDIEKKSIKSCHGNRCLRKALICLLISMVWRSQSQHGLNGKLKSFHSLECLLFKGFQRCGFSICGKMCKPKMLLG